MTTFPEVREALNLHGAIMNSRCDVDANLPNGCGEAMAYKHGHRDARHAAAELALKADARIDAQAAEIERLRKALTWTARALDREHPAAISARAALEQTGLDNVEGEARLPASDLATPQPRRR